MTSLLLPLYFQHQSDSAQSQMMSQLASVESQQHVLLTSAVSSPQLPLACLTDTTNKGDFSGKSGPLTITNREVTITNCGAGQWETPWLSINPGSAPSNQSITVTVDSA